MVPFGEASPNPTKRKRKPSFLQKSLNTFLVDAIGPILIFQIVRTTTSHFSLVVDSVGLYEGSPDHNVLTDTLKVPKVEVHLQNHDQ